jgi:hypothetical protein
VSTFWLGILRRIPGWGYALAAIVLVPILIAPLFAGNLPEAGAPDAKPPLLLSVLLSLHNAVTLPLLPIFAILRFLEDYVTFLFNQINGIVLYVCDDNFAVVRGGAAECWDRICQRAPFCRRSFSRRIVQLRQTLEKLQETENPE